MASVLRMTDMSDKDYMPRVRTVPTTSRHQDATTYMSAIKEIDSKLNQLEEIGQSLTQQKVGLFEPSSMKLKARAKEQFGYVEETLSTTSTLKDQLQSLNDEILLTQQHRRSTMQC